MAAITSGARGIGRAIAEAFAREGASVHVVDATPGDRFVGDIAGPDAAQQPVGRVGRPEDIAALALFLCSDEAGFITGENTCADGGMTRLMICHGEHGWAYAP